MGDKAQMQRILKAIKTFQSGKNIKLEIEKTNEGVFLMFDVKGKLGKFIANRVDDTTDCENIGIGGTD